MPPAFSADRGFFVFGDGRVENVDLGTGAVLWSADAPTVLPPALGDGLLFLAEREAIAALRQDDGSPEWRWPLVEPLAAPLAWDNGWLIASTRSGSVLAFRASDGRLIWRREIGSAARARAALAADRVYIPVASARVVALKVETGATVWERALEGAPNELLAFDDRLYVGSDDNFFYCLKAEDGAVDWRWRTGADVIGLPAVDGRAVYFVSKDNMLRALNPRSGNQIWKRALPLRPGSGPVRLGDALVVSGVAPALRAFQARDGAPAGDARAEGELAAAPHAFEGEGAHVLAVVTRDASGRAALTAFIRAAGPPPTPAAPASTAPRAGDTR